MCDVSCCKPYKSWDYIYCFSCDNVVLMKDCDICNGGCKECRSYNHVENRVLLPHYKAKPIIESQFIPEIAQIIFDYYYKPRRYFDGEF